MINIDFETRSVVDLTQAGAHIYATHPSTRILCMGWRVDGAARPVWIAGDPFPHELAERIQAGEQVHAWNAAFERLIWPIMVERHGAPAIRLEQWRCTMVRAMLQGFPAKLDAAGPSMGLSAHKDYAGHRLMLQVSKPRKIVTAGDTMEARDWEQLAKDYVILGEPLPEYEITELGGIRYIVRWWVDYNRLCRIYTYCAKDVEVEYLAGQFLDPIPDSELEGWRMDQRINDRGFYVDRELVTKTKDLIRPATEAANTQLKRLTDGQLTHVTKPNDIRAWINKRLGLNLSSIDKDTLGILKVECPMDDTTREVIDLRLAAGKTSTAKLNALIRGIGPDNIFRGGLQYAGAPRTNRWGGRRFQPHNIPRPPSWAIEAVPLILDGAPVDVLEILFGPALEVISAILRSCITARPGNELTVADYNAIEARIYAWLCGARRILEAYRRGEDPYRIMAASIYGIEDWRSIAKDAFERFLGKKIILGCGYGMGKKRFWDSCREDGLFIDMGLASRSIDTYRGDNPEVPLGWRALEGAAIHATLNHGIRVPCLEGKIHFYHDNRFLRMRLPSGRLLSYQAAHCTDGETPWGAPCKKLWFWAWNGQANRMEWQNLYGGRIMENACQAIARDVMLDAMVRLDVQGWALILSVHDEILSDNPVGSKSLDDMLALMAQAPHWAPGLPLLAEGWQGHRYRK